MDEQNIKELLRIILDSLQSKKFVWRFEGSANLKIQSVKVSVLELDRKLDMFDKIEKISWNDLQVPILPLKYAKKFYELLTCKEKADLISEYLSSRPYQE